MPLWPVIPGYDLESSKSWIPDQAGDDEMGAWVPASARMTSNARHSFNCPVIPGYDRESRKSWIPDQVGDDEVGRG